MAFWAAEVKSGEPFVELNDGMSLKISRATLAPNVFLAPGDRVYLWCKALDVEDDDDDEDEEEEDSDEEREVPARGVLCCLTAAKPSCSLDIMVEHNVQLTTELVPVGGSPAAAAANGVAGDKKAGKDKKGGGAAPVSVFLSGYTFEDESNRAGGGHCGDPHCTDAHDAMGHHEDDDSELGTDEDDGEELSDDDDEDDEDDEDDDEEAYDFLAAHGGKKKSGVVIKELDDDEDLNGNKKRTSKDMLALPEPPAKKQAVKADGAGKQGQEGSGKQQGQKAKEGAASAPATPAGATKEPKHEPKSEKKPEQPKKQELAKQQAPKQEPQKPQAPPAKQENDDKGDLMSGHKTDVRKFENGFMIEKLALGKPGAQMAKAGKKVVMSYVGKLASNGKIFDQNKKFQFRLGVGEVIKGWDLGIAGMRVGERRKLTIPPQLGYGQAGSPPVIPRNATLVFDVELKEVK
eukprot:jgi/Mesvir1/7106/Mv09211-RA.1